MKGYLLGKVIFSWHLLSAEKFFCFNTHILAYNYSNKVYFFTLGDCCQYYEIMAIVVKIKEVTTFPHTHTPTLQLILNSFGGKMQTFKLSYQTQCILYLTSSLKQFVLLEFKNCIWLWGWGKRRSLYLINY